jgi:hypothetical protein
MDVVDPLTQVRETCASVAAQAAHVTIDPQGAQAVHIQSQLHALRSRTGSLDCST